MTTNEQWKAVKGEENMKANDFRPLQEYIDTLPKPETFREKLLCLWSNLIDGLAVLKRKFRIRRTGNG